MIHAREDYNQRIQDSAGIIPDDEPVFLLRAQDRLAREALVMYYESCLDDDDVDGLQSASVLKAIGMFDDWRSKHGAKTPDLSKDISGKAGGEL
jgi:hypothetical protein